MKRKEFLRYSAGSFVGMLYAPTFLKGHKTENTEPYEPAIVKEFVGAGHNNLAKVKEMLGSYPNIIYAAYDWGNGDFETALEGAGHVGDKEIANFLIEKGARTNIFILTMLGKTDLVKPVLEEWPALINSSGAHGFTLLHHAQRGGAEAEPLLNYLLERGLRETKFSMK